MKHNNLLLGIIRFYYEGFRSMTLGKTLWAVIIVKLIIIFVVLKIFFFPNYIREHQGSRSASDFVSSQLLPK